MFIRVTTFFCLILAFKICSATAQQKLIMCVDHYPPLQIIKDNGEVTGENVEVAKSFFTRTNIEISFTSDTPFNRCLNWLKKGRVDIMIEVLGAPERFESFEMLLYDDLTLKRFFIKKNGPPLKSFKDLYGLNVATLRGVKQFPKFDNSQGVFTKVEVSTLLSAFGMLYKGRVDTVLSTENYGEQILSSHPEYAKSITKSDYLEKGDTKTYIALSKASPRIKRIDIEKLKSLAKSMYEDGEFASLIIEYQRGYPQYYQSGEPSPATNNK